MICCDHSVQDSFYNTVHTSVRSSINHSLDDQAWNHHFRNNGSLNYCRPRRAKIIIVVMIVVQHFLDEYLTHEPT
jgi:hypothetical protein